MADYQAIIEEQKALLKAQLEKLSKTDITKLEEKKAKLQTEIEAIDAEIAEVLEAAGIDTSKPKGRAGKAKKQGVQVSADALKKRIQAADGKVLSIRAEGIDTKCVRALVEAAPDVFKYEKGTWPKVSLKK